MAIAGLVDRDAVNPSPKARLTSETMNGPEHPEKDFLGEIERFVSVAEQVDRKLHHHPLVVGDQFGARGFVAPRATLNKGRFPAVDIQPTDGACLLH